MYIEIDEDRPNKIKLTNFEWRSQPLLNSIPSSKSVKNGGSEYWNYNLSWPILLALKYTFKDELEAGPKIKAWADNIYQTVILPSYNLRSEIQAEGYEGLFEHQKADVQFLATARRALLANDMGTGKAQGLSEPILTPNGWTTMGEVSVGDYVIGKSGNPIEILATYPQGVRDVYKVTLKDGSFTYCDIDHLWDVQTMRDSMDKRHKILSTRDLLEYGLVQPKTNNLKYKIPMVEPVNFEKKGLQLSPYIMGAILGDGGLTRKSITFTSADIEIVKRINEELPEGISLTKAKGSDYGYSFSKNIGSKFGKTNPINTILREHDLFGKSSSEKFIPTDYKFSSVQDRIDLLQGLMDTDGTSDKNQHTFCTVSYQLAYDVREVVQSLGGTAVWNYHRRPKGGNYDPITLHIRLPDNINPFYISRKADKVSIKEKYKLSRYISKIEYSHKEETKCIAVDAPDRLYVTRDYIVTHNTRSVVSTIRYLYEQGENVFPVLIACPNSTKFAWEDEIEKAWPGLKVNVIDGTAAKRKKLLEEKAHIYVINWEAIRTHSRLLPFGSKSLKKCTDCGGSDPKVKVGSCESHIKELNKIQFGAVIGDEIHRIIDPSSKIARSFKAATGDTDFRFGLSGTPLSANPGDMFSILQWLYPEGYPSKGKYVERYCQVIDGYWSDVIAGIKPERKEEFFAGIDPFLRRIPKELVLQFLPPLLRTRRDVEMGTKQKKAYTQMRDQMIAEVENDDMVITTSPLTRMIRMLQFSSAYAEVEYIDVYNEETATVEHKPHVKLSNPSCKLDAFMEDIPDFGDESVVVFAVSKQLINMLAERLEKENIPYGLITGDQDAVERKEHMKRFQDGDTRFILCTISAGGTGITLTKGSKMVFLQRSWSMIENNQAEARAYRIGSEQHESVQIIDYVTRDSSEEVVFKAVEAKGEQLEAILRDKDLMKRYLKGQE